MTHPTGMSCRTPPTPLDHARRLHDDKRASGCPEEAASAGACVAQAQPTALRLTQQTTFSLGSGCQGTRHVGVRRYHGCSLTASNTACTAHRPDLCSRTPPQWPRSGRAERSFQPEQHGALLWREEDYRGKHRRAPFAPHLASSISYLPSPCQGRFSPESLDRGSASWQHRGIRFPSRQQRTRMPTQTSTTAATAPMAERKNRIRGHIATDDEHGSTEASFRGEAPPTGRPRPAAAGSPLGPLWPTPRRLIAKPSARSRPRRHIGSSSRPRLFRR